MARTWKAIVVALLLSAGPAWAGDGNGKVKVFILAGQSNMEGLGHTRTLAHLGTDPQYGSLLKKIRNDDGSWVTRDDVFVSFRGGKTTGPLSVGFGANKEFVGPELMFGVIMGDAYKDQVAAAIKDKLEGKPPKEQTDAQNKALDEAVRATPEFKAWQAEWDSIFSHWPCHYYGNGRNYCLIGYGLGEAMKELCQP